MSRDLRFRGHRKQNRFQFLHDTEALVVMADSYDECFEVLRARIDDYSPQEFRDKSFYIENWRGGRWVLQDENIIPSNVLLAMWRSPKVAG